MLHDHQTGRRKRAPSKFEMSSAIHLPFEYFQAIDLTFRLALSPLGYILFRDSEYFYMVLLPATSVTFNPGSETNLRLVILPS